MRMKLSGCCACYSLSVARCFNDFRILVCCRRFGTIGWEAENPLRNSTGRYGRGTHMRQRVCRKTRQIACAHVSSKEIVKGEHIYNNSPKWAKTHECARAYPCAEREKYSQVLIINNYDLLNLSNFSCVFHTLSRAIQLQSHGMQAYQLTQNNRESVCQLSLSAWSQVAILSAYASGTGRDAARTVGNYDF